MNRSLTHFAATNTLTTPLTGRSKMLELPPELHLRIAECLSQADLFNFRLSCKTLSSPGHSVLFSPQKASRLYIHPTTIQRFIDVCHDDALATKVTTVIVLGDFMLGEFVSAPRSNYLISVSSTDNFQVCNPPLNQRAFVNFLGLAMRALILLRSLLQRRHHFGQRTSMSSQRQIA